MGHFLETECASLEIKEGYIDISMKWGWSKSSFTLFVNPRWTPASRCFLPYHKILFLAEANAFWNLENIDNYSKHADLNRVFQKNTIFEISEPFSYIFYPIILKLNLVVLGEN